MTAASGLLHKEYHEQEFSKQGGLFQMVQLWVNLPAENKMSSPKYQALTHDQMGKYQLPGSNGSVEVVAGNFKDVEGLARSSCLGRLAEFMSYEKLIVLIRVKRNSCENICVPLNISPRHSSACLETLLFN